MQGRTKNILKCVYIIFHIVDFNIKCQHVMYVLKVSLTDWIRCVYVLYVYITILSLREYIVIPL